MLAGVLVAVEEVPQLRALVLRVPLAELVPVREKPLFGAGFFFVPACAAEGRVDLQLFNGV